MSNQIKVNVPDNFIPNTGTMKVTWKHENGLVLTKECGFTITEEGGKVLAFDFINHPDLGNALLFGDQVFVLKFWDTEDLQKGKEVFSRAIAAELQRRNNVVPK